MAFNFLQKGAQSQKLAQQQQAQAEAAKSQQGKLFRFWLKQKEEARITFVDGELSPEGFLLPDRFFEHNLNINGKWNNYFVCPQHTLPDSKHICPICESGDKPYLASLFTIIDHRQGTSSKGTIYKDTKKLLVVKPQTFELLNKQAVKRGGLAGATFDVSRIGDKAAAVGSVFDFVEKHPIEDLKKLYMVERLDPKTNQKVKMSNFTPANYSEEITFYEPSKLKEILGAPSSASAAAQSATEDTPDYTAEL